jgi:hypothetical protein
MGGGPNNLQHGALIPKVLESSTFGSKKMLVVELPAATFNHCRGAYENTGETDVCSKIKLSDIGLVEVYGLQVNLNTASMTVEINDGSDSGVTVNVNPMAFVQTNLRLRQGGQLPAGTPIRQEYINIRPALLRGSDDEFTDWSTAAGTLLVIGRAG